MTGLQPWLSPYAEALVRLGAPYGVKVTSTYRSYSEQLTLWRNRYNNPYPVAPPGRSKHQLGRAFDISGPAWVFRPLGAILERWGGTWGGRFGAPDVIHFEA